VKPWPPARIDTGRPILVYRVPRYAGLSAAIQENRWAWCCHPCAKGEGGFANPGAAYDAGTAHLTAPEHTAAVKEASDPCDTHGWTGCKVCADREREGQWPDGHRKELGVGVDG
jgi:hypothetical protein